MILVTAVVANSGLITNKPMERNVLLFMFHPDLNFNILMMSERIDSLAVLEHVLRFCFRLPDIEFWCFLCSNLSSIQLIIVVVQMQSVIQVLIQKLCMLSAQYSAVMLRVE